MLIVGGVGVGVGVGVGGAGGEDSNRIQSNPRKRKKSNSLNQLTLDHDVSGSDEDYVDTRSKRSSASKRLKSSHSPLTGTDSYNPKPNARHRRRQQQQQQQQQRERAVIIEPSSSPSLIQVAGMNPMEGSEPHSISDVMDLKPCMAAPANSHPPISSSASSSSSTILPLTESQVFPRSNENLTKDGIGGIRSHPFPSLTSTSLLPPPPSYATAISEPISSSSLTSSTAFSSTAPGVVMDPSSSFAPSILSDRVCLMQTEAASAIEAQRFDIERKREFNRKSMIKPELNIAQMAKLYGLHEFDCGGEREELQKEEKVTAFNASMNHPILILPLNYALPCLLFILYGCVSFVSI